MGTAAGTEQEKRCALCEREVAHLTLHHLVPRAVTKRKETETSSTIAICSACHRQLHALFPHRSLAGELSSVEAIRAHPSMAAFIRWVRKQDPNRRIRVTKAKRG